jgi:hypothetical protein
MASHDGGGDACPIGQDATVGLNPMVNHLPTGQLVGELLGLTLVDALPAQTGEV